MWSSQSHQWWRQHYLQRKIHKITTNTEVLKYSSKNVGKNYSYTRSWTTWQRRPLLLSSVYTHYSFSSLNHVLTVENTTYPRSVDSWQISWDCRCICCNHKLQLLNSSNAARVTSAVKKNIFQLECGPMPNVMTALPNIGGAICSTPKSLANAQYSSAVQ